MSIGVRTIAKTVRILERNQAQDAYLLYKGRDSTEKLFRADKSYLGSKSLRICSNAALDAKTLIGFTALIIRNRIYSLLKHQMLKLNIRRNYMTVPAAIVELNKLEMVKVGQGDYQLHHAITKTQKNHPVFLWHQLRRRTGVRQSNCKDPQDEC